MLLLLLLLLLRLPKDFLSLAQREKDLWVVPIQHVNDVGLSLWAFRCGFRVASGTDSVVAYSLVAAFLESMDFESLHGCFGFGGCCCSGGCFYSRCCHSSRRV